MTAALALMTAVCKGVVVELKPTQGLELLCGGTLQSSEACISAALLKPGAAAIVDDISHALSYRRGFVCSGGTSEGILHALLSQSSAQYMDVT